MTDLSVGARRVLVMTFRADGTDHETRWRVELPLPLPEGRFGLRVAPPTSCDRCGATDHNWWVVDAAAYALDVA